MIGIRGMTPLWIFADSHLVIAVCEISAVDDVLILGEHAQVPWHL
jgi:hypothetical protein